MALYPPSTATTTYDVDFIVTNYVVSNLIYETLLAGWIIINIVTVSLNISCYKWYKYLNQYI